MNRVDKHPIINPPKKEFIEFFFNDIKMQAMPGEIISSALFANGVYTFRHHKKDSSPQGIFCANGQCAQCLVLVDGLPQKACITPIKPGMHVQSLNDDPCLPSPMEKEISLSDINEKEIDVLIIGGGPAGLSAAIELGKENLSIMIVDDKEILGGKLVLQTHQFFGSIDDCYAGTRGIDIGNILSEKVKKYSNIEVNLETIAIGVFEDGKIGISNQTEYMLIKPKVLLNTAGAREKAIAFPGCTLPGVYGAGAFQTLVNRDLIKTSERVFVIGGGNVGLIAAYHAIQAGMTVVGLIEAMSQCSGYYVHSSKLARLGAPIYTGHSVYSVNGKDKVESITITEIDENFNPIPNTKKTFLCDTVLVSVGLTPIDEFTENAKKFNIPVFTAGDAHEIAEASAAMFGGKLAGLEILNHLGYDIPSLDPYKKKQEILSSRPQKTYDYHPHNYKDKKVFPVLHCIEEIPCNPCISVCPTNSILLNDFRGDILDLPIFEGKCSGCNKCVLVCPGLAITIIDKRKAPESFVHLIIPFEVIPDFKPGDLVDTVDINGNFIIKAEVVEIRDKKLQDRRLLVKLLVREDIAHTIVGIMAQNKHELEKPIDFDKDYIDDETIICRCERVTAGEIRELLKNGIEDLNQLKAIRVGMGACGGRTCYELVIRLLRSEGIQIPEQPKTRPIYTETLLSMFAGVKGDN